MKEEHGAEDLRIRLAALEKENQKLLRENAELERQAGDWTRLFLEPFLSQQRDMALWLDPNGVILDANELFCERFCKTRQDLAGTTVWTLFPGEPATRRQAYMAEVLRTRKPVRNIDERAGFWMDNMGFPILDADGNVASVICLMRDVTEQRRMEAALKKGEHFLRSIFSSIQDGISILDRNLEIIQVNATMERWYAHAMPLVGRKCFEAYHGHSHPCDICPTRQTLKTGKRAVELVPLTGPQGQEGWLELFAFPLEDVTTGELIGVIEYARDITARRKAEAERELLERELRQSQKLEALGTLTGGMAHEFNNLLAGIMGHAELLYLDAASDPAMQDELEQIVRAVRRGKQFTRQMLAFSRPQGPDRRILDLAECTGETLRMVRATLPSSIALRASLPETPALVTADQAQMQQVIMNLCLNAAHSMRSNDSPALTVSLASQRVEQTTPAFGGEILPGAYWRLLVEDTGHGMDGDLIERIFDPFFTTKGPGAGSGLGLSVVLGIVQGHGGRITVQSVPGKGSAFGVWLPRSEETEQPEAQDVPAAAVTRPADKRLRILFVDDEVTIVLWVDRALPRLGFDVKSFMKIEEALAAFREDPQGYDLVITDLTMPGMDGKEFAREIQRIRAGTPVILCTGHAELTDAEEVAETNILATLLKPFTIEELTETINSLFAS